MKRLIDMNEDELRELVRTVVLEATRGAPPPRPPAFLTAVQLAERLDLHERSVRNMARAGMPHVKVGSTYRFLEADVRAWLVERQRAA